MEIRIASRRQHHLARCAVAAMACAALPAAAAELPRQFDFTATFTWTNESIKLVALGDKNTLTSGRHSITASNDAAGNPFLSSMVADCAQQVTSIDGKYEQVGACSFEDAGGDQLYETYRATEPGKGTIAFIGGTGKFAGIRCEGKYWTVGFARKGASGVGKKQGRCTFAQ